MASNWLAGLSGALSGYSGVLQYEDKANKEAEQKRLQHERTISLENLRASNQSARDTATFAQQDKRDEGTREYNKGILEEGREYEKTRRGEISQEKIQQTEDLYNLTLQKQDELIAEFGTTHTPEETKKYSDKVKHKWVTEATNGLTPEDVSRFNKNFDSLIKDDVDAYRGMLAQATAYYGREGISKMDVQKWYVMNQGLKAMDGTQGGAGLTPQQSTSLSNSAYSALKNKLPEEQILTDLVTKLESMGKKNPEQMAASIIQKAKGRPVLNTGQESEQGWMAPASEAIGETAGSIKSKAKDIFPSFEGINPFTGK